MSASKHRSITWIVPVFRDAEAVDLEQSGKDIEVHDKMKRTMYFA